MNNIYIILDSFTNGYDTILLDIYSMISVLLASLVIIKKNPVQSVIYLISLFLIISLYLINIGATFIGLSYLLVYVGAVSILFLFILMLINIRISELLSDTRNSISLVILVSIFFGVVLQNILSFSLFNGSLNNNIYHYINNEWDNCMVESSHITSIGNIMYTNFFMWLLITSLILLLAMVGAIVITIKSKDLTKEKEKENINNNFVTLENSVINKFILTFIFSAFLGLFTRFMISFFRNIEIENIRDLSNITACDVIFCLFLLAGCISMYIDVYPVPFNTMDGRGVTGLGASTAKDTGTGISSGSGTDSGTDTGTGIGTGSGTDIGTGSGSLTKRTF